MVDVVKCFVVYYILLTPYSQQTFLLVKQQDDTNILTNIPDKSFPYNYQEVQVI